MRDIDICKKITEARTELYKARAALGNMREILDDIEYGVREDQNEDKAKAETRILKAASVEA